jgi:hypothetical protein
MADDLLGDLLDLEDGFYKEGYEAGIADSAYAGTLEGKLFGIEKGYDKALELGKLHGRALVWQQRQQADSDAALSGPEAARREQTTSGSDTLSDALSSMASLAKNARLEKNIEGLLSLSDPKNLPTDNSDESVSQMEDAIAKSKAKAKMIAIAAGEPLDAAATPSGSIEDSMGLNARH